MCAQPTAPTVTSLTTEALKKATHTTPSAAELTRAAGWMEEVKSDIADVFKNLKTVYKTAFLPTTIGKHRYANPTDYGSEMNLTLLYGTHTGTSQAGSASTITLSANEDVTEDFIIGKYMLVTSDTGAGSCSPVVSYSTSTKIAGVSPDFETAPGVSGYMLIDSYYNLVQEPIWDLDKNLTPTIKGQPTHYLPIGDADDGEIVLYPTPDKVYGMQMRYYADIARLDLSGTAISSLYRKLRSVWIQGVYVRALASNNDTRYPMEQQKYDLMLQKAVANEVYGADLSNLQMRVCN